VDVDRSRTINLEGMRIVLDLAWGASVGLAPAVFRRWGQR